jgi:hypothetical protein
LVMFSSVFNVKVFHNEVRLPHSNGHPKCFMPPTNLCPRWNMLSIRPFQFYASFCWVFIKFDEKFDSTTLLEISFMHLRNASLLHTLTQLAARRAEAIELKLAQNIKYERKSLLVSEAWLQFCQLSSHAFTHITF